MPNGQPQSINNPLTPPKPVKAKNRLVPVLIVIIVILVVGGGAAFYYLYTKQVAVVAPQSTPTPLPIEPVKIDLAIASKDLIDPANLDLETVTVNPQIPAYQLPLAPESVANYQTVMNKLGVSEQAQYLLQQNGFVVTPTSPEIADTPDDFADFYSQLKWQDLPIFITSDSLLHYYHIFFDTTLMKMERDLFYDNIWQLSQKLYDDSLYVYNNSGGDLKEAAKRNLAYLAVALEVLQPQPEQVTSQASLSEEYCQDWMSAETCQQTISDVQSMYDDKASFKYFSQAEASKYSFTPVSDVQDLVAAELALINAHEGWDESPVFIYKEDYSQYVPRGHYTKSEKLKNYFKALMWYGRMTALINGDKNVPRGKSECNGLFSGIVSEYDAKVQTLQASILSEKFLASQDLQELWQRMYAITAFFVGFSDDLGPYEYSQAISKVFGSQSSVSDFEAKYADLKTALDDLTYEPKIYSGLGQCELFIPELPLDDTMLAEVKDQAKRLLGQTKGFRLMGQRFTIDSYLMSEIVSPYSGEYKGEADPLPSDDITTFTWDDQYTASEENRPFTWSLTPIKREVRGFPRGLDLMAALGSEQAMANLQKMGDTQYGDYASKFISLKQQFDDLDQADWYQNLYWNWLYSLQGLLGSYGSGYQSFMQTPAWKDKQLNTALASWSELRHDTILYVKQSYTMAELGGAMVPEIVGYVEPVPEFYVRLLNLTRLMNNGLAKLIPEEQLRETNILFTLNQFEDIMTELIAISQKELANQPLTQTEYDFIADFGETSKNLIEMVSGGEVDPEIFKTVMVADVHTDGNSMKVLEEGVGYLKTMLVAYKLPDDRILIGVGPAFSYYEFKQDMANRLTDEAWRTMLDSGIHPDQPDWTNSFSE